MDHETGSPRKLHGPLRPVGERVLRGFLTCGSRLTALHQRALDGRGMMAGVCTLAATSGGVASSLLAHHSTDRFRSQARLT
jgi:hypothetical protein